MSDPAVQIEEQVRRRRRYDDVIDWLKRQFAEVSRNNIQTKREIIIQAGRMLVNQGMEQTQVAAELVSHAKALHVSRSWIYEILPGTMKDPAKIEQIMKGISKNTSCPVPDMVLAKATDIDILSLQKNMSRIMPYFKWVVESAKEGDCRECQCINCQKLRGVDF